MGNMLLIVRCSIRNMRVASAHANTGGIWGEGVT